MKQKTKIFLSAVVMLPLLFCATAVAQENRNETSENGISELEHRLQERKEATKTRIDAAERLVIQARCKASQAHLRRLNSRIVGIRVSRKAVYDNVTKRLADLGTKLRAKGIDTAEYDKQVGELQIKIDSFYAALEQYEEAVNDLAAMDCAADPEGYRATLESAKILRTDVIQTAQAVHSYLHDTIKPTLQNIRQQVGGEAQNMREEHQNHGE